MNTDSENCLNEPLFYNHNIVIGDKSVFYKSWYQKGVTCINDIFDKDNIILTKDHLQNLFGLSINILHYMGIKNSIKKFLKKMKINVNIIDKQQQPFLPTYLSVIIKNKQGTNAIYKIFNNNTEKPTSQIKWQHKFSVEQTKWKSYYSLPFNNTKNTSAQWLQFRILHRILPVNEYLFKLKLKDSPLCSYCNVENESIEHLFWSCVHTSRLLNEVKLVCERNNIQFQVNERKTILGTNNIPLYNTLLLIKQFIFQNRFLNGTLTFPRLKFFLQ
jgi:hypothetical protein